MEKVNLQKLFDELQTELLAKLNVGKTISHSTAKGDDTEINWLEVLQSLPVRYDVERGFVVDSDGQLSQQIDAIVYDRYYSPLILRRDSTIYVPAESVYAVLEVKQDLSKETLEYAGGKAKSVRELNRISAPIRLIDGSLKRKDNLPPILAGIMATRSAWNPPFGTSFVDVLNGLDMNSKLDLGIALKNGSFDCTYSETGETNIRNSEADESLISFFINLTKQLQLLGNAPGIDLDAYYNCYEE